MTKTVKKKALNYAQTLGQDSPETIPLAAFSSNSNYFQVVRLFNKCKVISRNCTTGAIISTIESDKLVTAICPFQLSKDFVACGLEDGGVLVYSVAPAALQHALPAPDASAPAKVASLSYNDGKLMVLSCTGNLSVFDMNSPSKAISTASFTGTWTICAFSEKLAIAESKILVLENDKQMEYLGHATTLTGLVFTSKSEYLISAASQDRFISVWDTAQGKNVLGLTLDSAVVRIAVSDSDRVAAVNEAGELCVWNSVAEIKSTTPQQPKKKSKKQVAVATHTPVATYKIVVVDVQGDGKIVERTDTANSGILDVTFVQDQALISYGNPMKPCFETVTITETLLDGSVELKKGVQILKRVERSGKFSDPESQIFTKASEVNGIKSARAISNEIALPQSRHEISLQERIDSMTLEPKSQSTQSLTSMLTQGLLSEDKALLDQCFECPSKIIKATVGRMSGVLVGKLVQVLAERILKSEDNENMSVWIRACISSHTGYIMSNVELRKSMRMLYQAIRRRVGNFEDYLLLNGKLDLILSQKKSENVVDEESNALLYEEEDVSMDESDHSYESEDSDKSHKIVKSIGQEADELELQVAQNIFDLEQNVPELKADLRVLQFTSAKEIEVGHGKKAIVIFVPVPLLKQFHKVQSRLVRELEKKFSDRHVLLVAQRRIMKKPARRSRVTQMRPRSRTLTTVHEKLLEDLVYPTEIVGKRTKVKTDGSKLIKVFLDRKDHTSLEYKLDTFSSAYRKLTGKEVVFEFPVSAQE